MRKNQQSGFTLIEVLVALVVLAIGLLGLSSLQNQGLRFNRVAYLDSQATSLANDLLERIRVNRNVSSYVIDFEETAETATVDCTTDSCDPDEMATWDLEQWRDELANQLPAGTGSVELDDVAKVFTITVRYEDEVFNTNDEEGIRELIVRSRV